ncbi:MAG TPA: alkaline phosphatase family protein [Candidatus Acidoferrales bacterium]|nr:alkaline phosphatase family protein [Candidatus Acidoferrales bacterium]
MTQGLDELKRIVVLMMENRSFDHMLGGLRATDARVEGLTGDESNLDAKGNPVQVQKVAKFQGQLNKHDPDHHFPGVDLQIFDGNNATGREATMKGFVKSYYTQTNDLKSSHAVMYYFDPKNLPVLTALATEYVLFNGWFSSIPGPTICNRAFAHYGTSFGQVGMGMLYITKSIKDKILTVYERMLNAGRKAKLYYYDQPSSTMEVLNLLQRQPQLFGTFEQFIGDCKSGSLPEYSFVEPCYRDHYGDDGGAIIASDQHPDHDVRAGEEFIAKVYNAIRTNPDLWSSTALLIVYDEHGGLYDHVVPPLCTPDGYVATAADTMTGEPFAFNRLGVRVPAILVSPWVTPGTVVAGSEDKINGRIFEHASIPATVTNHFLLGDAKRTIREQKAQTFLDLLTDQMRPEKDCITFDV